MNLLKRVQSAVRTALTGMVADPEPYAAMVKPAQDARFGDYQANCAMPLQKVLGKKPREVAEEIVRRLDLGDVLEKPEIAGPGFINFKLKADWLARQLRAVAADERLGVEKAGPARTLVIDYSSPNVAKPMHVGHLRSTIIGDCLKRLFRFLGHTVIADNHLGDWGLQFGMLLYGYKHHRDEAALAHDPVQEMVRLYLLVRKQIKPAEAVEDNPQNAANSSEDHLAQSRAVLAEVRQETTRLHEGDSENRRLWATFMPWCYAELEPIYKRLDVDFDYTHGESFYQDALPGVVEDLQRRGIAVESDGAVVVHLAEGDPPALVRYRKGAYTYTTSDLATIKYRVDHWHPDTILYVVGTPQSLHFKNLFAVARRWGYDRVQLEHVAFGYVLGKDGKVLRTREGGAPELQELLNEAVAQAARVYEQNRPERLEQGLDVPELSPAELRNVHDAVGLGAVKYADLSQNRLSDYVFDPVKMTATEGNTATYMQYAYARNRSIFRKGDEDAARFRANPPLPSLGQPEERALALQLLRFGEVLEAAAAEYKPNAITAYLWDLAKAYSGFFVNCPVLKAETPPLRDSRLLLCDLTARVIQKGLDLLGIRTLERM
jgi:arginyl-tRNA synthetase